MKGAIELEAWEVAITEMFVIVNAVRGVDQGAYYYDAQGDQLRKLKSGDFRQQAQQLALGQSLAGQAAVNVYWLTKLEAVLDALGDRAYRLAQLQAAEAAGRGYLAAYALGLGATGLTFFDEAVVEFFAPASQGMEVMFLLAAGEPG